MPCEPPLLACIARHSCALCACHLEALLLPASPGAAFSAAGVSLGRGFLQVIHTLSTAWSFKDAFDCSSLSNAS